MNPKNSNIAWDFSSAVEHLRELIAARKLVKGSLSNNSITSAFDVIGVTARSGEKTARLEAVSILGKASEISPSVAKIAQPLLEQALIAPLPHTGSWGSADDRRYLAKAILTCNEPWVAEYAAIELAQGEIAERLSRDLWAQIAVKGATTLADTLETVADALSEDIRSVGHSVDTVSRKLTRIAGALRDPMSLADIPPGEGFGKALANLVYLAGGREGPASRTLREQTGIEVLKFMVQVLRLKFAVALDTGIYQCAGTVLGWWKPAHPHKAVTAPSERIVSIGMEALHILARQGVAQKGLRQALVEAFGTEQVNRIGATIALEDPSLDPPIATWLSSGHEFPVTRSNPAVRNASQRDFDVLVANLILAVDQHEGGPQDLDLVANELEVLEPRYAGTIRAGADRLKIIRQWAHAVGESRSLVLSGERGAIVSYDPALHECDQDLDISARARIMTPAVLKRSGGQSSTVVLKARVEVP